MFFKLPCPVVAAPAPAISVSAGPSTESNEAKQIVIEMQPQPVISQTINSSVATTEGETPDATSLTIHSETSSTRVELERYLLSP